MMSTQEVKLEDAIGTLLNESEEKFVLTYRGKNDRWPKFLERKITLSIKPISGRTMLSMSRYLAGIDIKLDNNMTMFQGMLDNASHIEAICRCIAVATGAKGKRVEFLKDILLDLPLDTIKRLWTTVIAFSDAEPYFFCLASAKKVSLIENKTQKEE